jgi:hypothetical protein
MKMFCDAMSCIYFLAQGIHAMMFFVMQGKCVPVEVMQPVVCKYQHIKCGIK